MVALRKRFGQHFLEDAWARKVVDAIQPAPTDTFLEVGPGRGALTLRLAQASARVVANELDRDLAAMLRAAAPANVEVIAGDVLHIDVAAVAGSADVNALRLVGNLPYYISSPILFRALHLQRVQRLFRDATLMLQHEVVERVTAEPGSGEYGPLAIFTRLEAKAERLLTLPPGAFRPPPQVWSAVVQLVFRTPDVTIQDRGVFERMVRSLFTQRRKTVLNALKPFAASSRLGAREALGRAGIEVMRRPETLQLAEFARLADVFAAEGSSAVL